VQKLTCLQSVFANILSARNSGQRALQRKDFAMPTNSQDTPRSLPEQPNLRHLKAQAKDLFKAGEAASLTDAQFKIARLYGFASWSKLKAHLDSLAEIGQLKLAIEDEDLARVKALMTRNPALHRAPLGYGKNGPLTWVAECRIPCGGALW
jgi:hypothetical protein